jgi:hypothetical protein
MATGVRFGSKPKLSEYQRAEALKRRANGEKTYGVAVFDDFNPQKERLAPNDSRLAEHGFFLPL